MMSKAAADRILGSLRSADGKGIVRIEDRVDTGIDDLWSGLPIPAVSPAGSVRSRATSARAGSTASASLPADRKAAGAWRRASLRRGCW